MKPIIKNSLALMLLLLPVTEVIAAPPITCTRIDSSLPRNFNINVGGAIHVGVDKPIGSIIYTSVLTIDTYLYGHLCNRNRNANPHDTYFIYETTTLKMLSANGTKVTGIAGIPTNTYQTNIPGIGINFYANNDKNNTLSPGVPVINWEGNREISDGTLNGASGMKYWSKPQLNFSLIKIGPISPGIINLNNFTNIEMIIDYRDKGVAVIANDFPFVHTRYQLMGSISVTSSSCRTQDYNVNLGSHKIGELPTKGSTTKWINSDINLYSCPAFRGYYSGYRGNIISTENKQTFPDKSPNEIKVRIKPANPIISAYPGTFAIDNIPGAASGVGIQLAFGDTGEDFVSFNTLKTFSQPVTEKAGTVTIPLRARYIRVDDRISAGLANGAATFMIEYY